MAPLSRTSAKELAHLAGLSALAGVLLFFGALLNPFLPDDHDRHGDGLGPALLICLLCLAFSFACVIVIIRKGVRREPNL